MAKTTAQKNTGKVSGKANVAQATLAAYRQSPRKVRLVTRAISGKKVPQALITLRFADKKAADSIKKLLESALANAKNKGMKEEDLKISKITVDEGPILYRRRARARGTANPIRKRTSHIFIEVTSEKK